MTRDHRPRRSQQCRSSRTRAETRAHQRIYKHTVPNPARHYYNHRGTLTTLAVRARHDVLRRLRVERALVLVRYAEVYRPLRTWPNALPGGTSPRRAARRASWVVEVLLPIDVPPGWLDPLPD